MVCLAGALGSFRDAAEDLLRRLAGVRLSASTVLRATERAGEQLQQQQRQGDVAVPPKPTDWNFTVPKHAHTAAYLGLDAFSVPIQGPGGKKADSRMLYVGLLYTPDKKQTHYLVDFDLDQLARQMRRAAIALGLSRADQVLAISDAGNGLEAALKRHFWDSLLCILDWYHAAQHLARFRRTPAPRRRRPTGGLGRADQGHLVRAGRHSPAGLAARPAGPGRSRRGRRTAQIGQLLRGQRAPYQLPRIPPARLGHRQWPDGGRLQDRRRAAETERHALGAARGREGRPHASAV